MTTVNLLIIYYKMLNLPIFVVFEIKNMINIVFDHSLATFSFTFMLEDDAVRDNDKQTL